MNEAKQFTKNSGESFMSDFIPISKPSITQLELEYVTDAVRSTWISSLGKYIDQFEEEFAAFCGCRYAVSVSNGTVAIHLALVACGIGPGDEVIVPDLSFIATANTVLHAGATPVFVDIEPESLCMDPMLLEKAITPRTKAIMPVHLYGHPADMDAINKIARKHNLIVIEDAAEAHGASIGSRRTGGLGFCGTFSFYGNKNLTTGEGGMITTNDESLNQKCRYLRDHAMSKEKRFWHTEVGYNYRMTNMQAAIGCAQLKRSEELLNRRREIFEMYTKELHGKPGIIVKQPKDGVVDSHWLVCVELDKNSYEERDAVMERLKKEGVDSRPYFYPMSHMPYFDKADTPVSVNKSLRGINLPTFTDITKEEIKRVSRSLFDAI